MNNNPLENGSIPNAKPAAISLCGQLLCNLFGLGLMSCGSMSIRVVNFSKLSEV